MWKSQQLVVFIILLDMQYLWLLFGGIFFNIAVIRYLYYILNFILDRKLEEKDNLYYLKITCYPQNM